MILYIVAYFALGVLACVACRKMIAKEQGFLAFHMVIMTFTCWPLVFGHVLCKTIWEGNIDESRKL